MRFGVTDGDCKRAATWKCVISTGHSKNDVYLACRELGGAFKVSLHQKTGLWRIEFITKGFCKEDRWSRPKECAVGITLAFRIIIPSAAVTTPVNLSEKKDIRWILKAPKGMATEIALLFIAPNNNIEDWLEAQDMTCIDLKMLENGETVCAVYRTIEIPQFPKSQAKLRFLNEHSQEDLKTENLRFLQVNVIDGIRVLLDTVLIPKFPL